MELFAELSLSGVNLIEFCFHFSQAIENWFYKFAALLGLSFMNLMVFFFEALEL